MNNRKKYYLRWLLMAPAGLVLVGMGICFISESAMLKFSDAPTWEWVMAGTVSLSVFNAGLCVFGEAVVSRARYLSADLPEE